MSWIGENWQRLLPLGFVVVALVACAAGLGGNPDDYGWQHPGPTG